MLAGDDILEQTDGVLEWDKLALVTSEDLCICERLRHETLDLSCTLDLSEIFKNMRSTRKWQRNIQSICPPQTTRPYPR